MLLSKLFFLREAAKSKFIMKEKKKEIKILRV
jgi:hypothetical protein